jgi:uncharacterized protein YycO
MTLKNKLQKYILPIIASAIIATSPTQTKADNLDNIIKNIKIKTGDIIGHTSTSNQSSYIKWATFSSYTHVGIISKEDGKNLVIEAVQPVKYTELKEWIKRGKDSKFTIKRLENSTNYNLNNVVTQAIKHIGKDYDLKFEPDDKKMYCSEIINKAYERGIGVKIGKWEKFEDVYGLFRFIPKFRSYIRSRWGKSPNDMLIITPKSIMKSNNLDEIYSNY